MAAKSNLDSVLDPCKVSRVIWYSSVGIELPVWLEGLPKAFCSLFCESEISVTE